MHHNLNFLELTIHNLYLSPNYYQDDEIEENEAGGHVQCITVIVNNTMQRDHMGHLGIGERSLSK
jgi:hypothetical protein